MMQPASHLLAAGLKPEIRSLFDDNYLARLYAAQSTAGAAIRAFSRRITDLERSADCDLLWIESEILPWIPWAVERRLIPRKTPYVVDLDDAIFHRYDMHRLAPVRYMLGHKLDKLMAGSKLVTAGNGYLANRAIQAGAPRVEVVPTVVDIDAYLPVAPERKDTPNIGWIGSPSTWAEYMIPMMPMLSDTASRSGARLLAVGAGQAARPSPILDLHEWSEDAEIELIRRMDIGIMPLTDSPWSQGKCGYKLIQYMACGLPVVASPVGVNSQIVEHGVDGFLATTPDEWRAALKELVRDSALRRKMGAAGRLKIERKYSLQVWGPRIAELLLECAKDSSVDN